MLLAGVKNGTLQKRSPSRSWYCTNAPLLAETLRDAEIMAEALMRSGISLTHRPGLFSDSA